MAAMFDTDPGIDMKRQPDGSYLALDTPRMWRDWMQNIDGKIKLEVAHVRPEGGKPTWNDYWLWLIRANQTGRENSQKYIDYIVEKRRAMGLPELVDYP